MSSEEIQDDRETAYALVIGISEYKHGKPPGERLAPADFRHLRFAANDAEAFAKVLEENKLINKFKFENVEPLLNDKATLRNIRDAFDRLRVYCKGKKNPLVVVYFSGHGCTDEASRHYLAPHEAERDALFASAFWNEDFTNCLKQIETDKLVVLIDACHAGGMDEKGDEREGEQRAEHEGRGEGEGVSPKNMPQPQPQYDPSSLAAVGKRYFIASCGSGQQSYELESEGNSIFTWHLLQLLKGEDNAFGEEKIDLETLDGVLKKRVSATASKYGKRQEPFSKIEGGQGIVLAVDQLAEERAQQKQFLLNTIAPRFDKKYQDAQVSNFMLTLLRYVETGNREPGFEALYWNFKGYFVRFRNNTDPSNSLSTCHEHLMKCYVDASKKPSVEKAPPTTGASAQLGKDTLDAAPVNRAAEMGGTKSPLGSTAANTAQAGQQDIIAGGVNSILGLRTGTKRTKVFISHSNKDENWVKDLKYMMSPLVNKGLVNVWDDSKIETGALWKQEIQKALDETKVAVLLVSAHFLASEFITNEELPQFLDAAEKEGVKICWIYVSPCMYEGTVINSYQAAHPPKKDDNDNTLSGMNDVERQTVLKKICSEISKMVG